MNLRSSLLIIGVLGLVACGGNAGGGPGGPGGPPAVVTTQPSLPVWRA